MKRLKTYKDYTQAKIIESLDSSEEPKYLEVGGHKFVVYFKRENGIEISWWADRHFNDTLNVDPNKVLHEISKCILDYITKFKPGKIFMEHIPKLNEYESAEKFDKRNPKLPEKLRKLGNIETYNKRQYFTLKHLIPMLDDLKDIRYTIETRPRFKRCVDSSYEIVSGKWGIFGNTEIMLYYNKK